MKGFPRLEIFHPRRNNLSKSSSCGVITVWIAIISGSFPTSPFHEVAVEKVLGLVDDVDVELDEASGTSRALTTLMLAKIAKEFLLN